LSLKAQPEARIMMLSSNNIHSQSDGRAVAVTSQDMIIGWNHRTEVRDDVEGIGNSYSTFGEAVMAMDAGQLHLNATITIGVDGFVPSAAQPAPEGWEPGQLAKLETTLGRVLFNQLLPADYPLVETAQALDNLKDAGYYWGTWSGVTVAISDITSNFDKASIMESYEGQASKVQVQYETGLIADEERRAELIDIWNNATDEVASA